MTAVAVDHLAPLAPGALLIGTPNVAESARESRWPLHVTQDRTALAALMVEPPDGMKDSMCSWAADMSVPIVSESVALGLIRELNEPLGSGWCSCKEPRTPSRRRFTWEDHQWGTCGWPEQSCSDRQHRLTRCRTCGMALQYQVCELESGGTGYTRDQQRGWWVHEVCGWPSPEYLAEAVGGTLPDLDGTPTLVWRVFRGGRSERDAKLMPFPDEQLKRLDALMDGKVYLD